MSVSPRKRANSSLRSLIEIAALEARVMMSAAHSAVVSHPAPMPEMDTEPAISAPLRDLPAASLESLAPLLAAPTGKLPLSSIPILHSHPSSIHKVYLDFVGAPAFTWGAYSVPATPAYTQDSDATTFTQPELNAIQQIWARVSEHFSPFDLDITTENPGNFTAGQNVRVLIGGSGSWYMAAGGVTYIGGYTINDPVHNYTTSNVFPGQLSNGNPVFVGEAAAHELGHMFGLQHQSSWSGDTKTAEYRVDGTDESPIMGDSYYATRGVWAQGTSSLGPNVIQDDLAVLSANNFGYRADDFGNSAASAFPLTASGDSLSASGVIETTADTDWFSFTTQSGLVTLNVAPSQNGGMLDATLKIVNSNGAVVASADTASLGESLSLNLPTGTYVAVVGSHGAYGDVGQYTLSGTIVNDPYFIAAPTDLTAARGSGAVALSWTDNATTETSYLVQRSSDNGATWSTIATLAAGVGTYNDSNVVVGNQYAYRVIGTNAVEQSQASNVATIALSLDAPRILAATAISASQVQLTWTASIGGTGYRIQQSTDNGASWTTSGSVTPFTQSFTATALSPATAYMFRVIVTSTAGDSSPSVVMMALTFPGSPSSLTAAPVSSSAMQLNWSAVAGAGGYRIERLINSNWLLVGTIVGQSTTYTDTDLSAGSAYQYRVRAFDASGQSDASNVAQMRTYLATPTGLSATGASNSQVNISWPAANGAAGYLLEFTTAGSSTWNILAQFTDATTLHFTQTGLSAGTVYSYRLTAIGAIARSLPSDSISTITLPSAPGSFEATAVAPTRVNITWSAVLGATLGYTLERSTDGENFDLLAHLRTGQLSYLDSSAQENVTYSYRLHVSNESGDSPLTATQSATPSEANDLLAPSGLSAAVISSDAVKLSWQDNSGNESGFSIQRSADGGADWEDVAVADANSTTFSDTTALRGTNYLYRVQAVNPWMNSAFADPASVLTVPADVTNVHVIAANTSAISLAWDNVATATGFQLEMNAGNGWTPLGTVDDGTTNFTADHLDAGKAYQFRVTAVNGSGSANPSTVLSAITIPPALENLLATAVTPTQVNLQWQNVPGNSGYLIERSEDGGATWSAINTTSPDVTQFADDNAAPGATFTYRVFATNSAGTSDASPLATATPMASLAVLAPSDLSSWFDNGRVMLRWTDNADNESGFLIQRSSDGGATFADLIDIPAADVTSYSDLSPARGQQYVYRVVAYNAWITTDGSVSVMVTPPPDVTDLYVNTIAATRIGLAWSDVAGESGFKIERSTDNITFTEIAHTGQGVTAFTDVTVTPGTRYYYRVRATGIGGDSGTTIGLGVSTPISSAPPPRVLPPRALGLFSRVPIQPDSQMVGPALVSPSQAVVIVVSPSQVAAALAIDQTILHVIGDEITL